MLKFSKVDKWNDLPCGQITDEMISYATSFQKGIDLENSNWYGRVTIFLSIFVRLYQEEYKALGSRPEKPKFERFLDLDFLKGLALSDKPPHYLNQSSVDLLRARLEELPGWSDYCQDNRSKAGLRCLEQFEHLAQAIQFAASGFKPMRYQLTWDF
ncbi:hypothetical protein [Neptuniibacter sp. QD37_11]|uniref:hypothetical protein n=1 Tax=Neptuniibacter sp. QD37_11 TaxID=3398209 RepID=UPI0039F53578